jgi:hypothetical protein
MQSLVSRPIGGFIANHPLLSEVAGLFMPQPGLRNAQNAPGAETPCRFAVEGVHDGSIIPVFTQGGL